MKRSKRLRLLTKSIFRALHRTTKGHRFVTGFLLLVVPLTFVLGMAGFHELDPEREFWSTLYLTMQLFLLNCEVDNIPATLQWARWLAVGIVFSAVGASVWKFLLKSQGRLRINLLSGHRIIFGSGPMVEGILKETDEAKKPCVLISSCGQLVQQRRHKGKLAVEIVGAGEGSPALEREHLEDVNLEDAADFLALSPSDPANLRAALLAREILGSAGADKIIVRQEEPLSCDLLQRNGLRVISAEKNRARALLEEVPLEWSEGQWSEEHGLAKEVHLVIPELDRFGKAVALQAALIGHYEGGKKVNLWLGPGKESEGGLSELEEDYPGVRKCLSLESLEGSSPAACVQPAWKNDGALVTVLMTHVPPEEGYLEAARLKEALPPSSHFRVILGAPLPGGLKNEELFSHLIPAPSPGSLFANLEKLDRVARKIHEVWHLKNTKDIEDERAEGDEKKAEELKSKPTYKKWEELTEQQKDDNRTAADHIEVKIRTVGLDPRQPDLPEKWENLSVEKLDRLSRMEHERWAAPLRLRNYEAGEERDDEARLHPDLVAYDQLDPETQKFDTQQVEKAAEYLEAKHSQPEAG